MSGRSSLWTPLCDLLGIRHALLLAGIAGEPNTPELVSEVSRSGGLGVLGVSGMTVARATHVAIARARRPGRRECARTPVVATGGIMDALTGRPARWIRNRFVDAVVAAQAGTLGWGAQGASIAEIRRAAAEQGLVDILPMLADQAAALASDPQPAAEIGELLVEQTRGARA